jgi:uncharacterized protein
MFHSALYRGTLHHSRRDDYAQRRFSYPVFTTVVDLDELHVLDQKLRWFSHNRKNLFSLCDENYSAGSASGLQAGDSLRAAVHARLAAENLPLPHRSRLVTNLSIAGYVFNPVSFFINYDAAGAISTVIAEVNNTYGGRFSYLLHDGNRRPTTSSTTTPGTAHFSHTREFFVSPFLHGDASYDFVFNVPMDSEQLSIRMDVRQTDAQRTFIAHLQGQRSPLTDRNLLSVAARYPFMTAQVIGLIHWQAVKLHALRVPFLHPLAGHRARDYPVHNNNHVAIVVGNDITK